MAGDKKSTTALTIRILGRDYPVACPDGERESLLRSAEYLSKRMAAIQRSGKTLGTERIAIMAALNISRELLDLQSQVERRAAGLGGSDEEMRERLAQLQLRIESALDDES
ncbi:cell division protein ZapA [Salinisphaera sp. Q1T1-3]|uniref:cell division protein ZapA n=1 Tax=Salinisphaera sp. Q1T1-3 TaxID=2321229 RepID=UPI000E74186F|nr:cell division protein ZapA [Salinisphaera sp. Q1T1-3]RJS94674.1 cell division protein ZapA [Salinisphaera sp. Q1T1-3]